MNDGNGESKPPKLKLSRDLKPSVEKPAPPPSAPPPAPPPSIAEPLKGPQIRKTSIPGAEKPNLEDFDPEDPFGDLLPGAGSAQKGSSPESKQNNPALELNRNRATPPELPSKPPPRKESAYTEKLEETIAQLPNDASVKKLPIGSILLVIALIAILFGAGAGIWYVLSDGSEPADPATATSPQSESPSGPVTRTRDTVDAAEERATSEVFDQTPSDATPEATTPAAASRPAPVAHAPAENLREPVSGFLTSVHVGGMRGGDEPRVMLDGKSYQIGEVVHPETGLTFQGTTDGRLVFQDRNGIRYLKSF